MIKCTKCGIEQKDTEFYLRRKCGIKRKATCRSCQRLRFQDEEFKEKNRIHQRKYRQSTKGKAAQKKWYAKIRIEGWDKWYARRGRNQQLKDNYGITEADYKRMNKEQKGVCAICNRPQQIIKHYEKQLPLVIDHDHKTGKVRALLCSKCNTGIAMFGENIEYLANAISYLEKHKAAELQEAMTGG